MFLIFAASESEYGVDPSSSGATYQQVAAQNVVFEPSTEMISYGPADSVVSEFVPGRQNGALKIDCHITGLEDLEEWGLRSLIAACGLDCIEINPVQISASTASSISVVNAADFSVVSGDIFKTGDLITTVQNVSGNSFHFFPPHVAGNANVNIARGVISRIGESRAASIVVQKWASGKKIVEYTCSGSIGSVSFVVTSGEPVLARFEMKIHSLKRTNKNSLPSVREFIPSSIAAFSKLTIAGREQACSSLSITIDNDIQERMLLSSPTGREKYFISGMKSFLEMIVPFHDFWRSYFEGTVSVDLNLSAFAHNKFGIGMKRLQQNVFPSLMHDGFLKIKMQCLPSSDGSQKLSLGFF